MWSTMACTRRLAMSSFLLILYVHLITLVVPHLQAFKFGPDRQLLEVNNGIESDGTARIDPLDSFKKYRGGYDIRNKHYWSSTVFTGKYGYAIAVVWLLCGFFYGVFLLVTTFCCKRERNKLKKRVPCHKQCYLWPFLSAIFFTVLAVIASGLVLGGNARFHSRADTVVDIIIDTADGASNTIYNTTQAMKEMSADLGATDQGPDATRFLTSTSKSLDSRAADIERQARKNRRAIEKGLRIVYIISTAIISVNLVAAICLSVFGILKFRRTLRWLIVLCWILTVLCWLFFGIYFFIDKFASDTCTAFENFQEDPYNSSLGSILPCDELVSARSVLGDVSKGIHTLVDQVNENISRSYGNFAQICQPFSEPPEYLYQPDKCASNTIRIEDIPQLLKVVTCTDPNCNGGIMITPREFDTMQAYATSIQNILKVYPGMERLVECKTVNDAFADILENHCTPLKRNGHLVWKALVFLSVVMVALVLTWTVEAAHEQRHHGDLDGSVKPHRAEDEELGTEPVPDHTSHVNTK
ncbi:uncharacterized protein LOC116014932 [Ipomoea triloba]|uniref:uncharacterized protein LOC116014932 n=1 Tax=Ipomoea triloba TaxID=35885 RepID=UPI00125E26D4|nr:uncharacterized protein LOC116014932 [Ipomoea triloba]